MSTPTSTSTPTPSTLDAIFDALVPLCHKLPSYDFMSTDLHVSVYNEVPSCLWVPPVPPVPPGPPGPPGLVPETETETEIETETVRSKAALLESSLWAVFQLVDVGWTRSQQRVLYKSPGFARCPLERFMSSLDDLCWVPYATLLRPSIHLECVHVRWFCGPRQHVHDVMERALTPANPVLPHDVLRGLVPCLALLSDLRRCLT
jgi:hypothetical protein